MKMAAAVPWPKDASPVLLNLGQILCGHDIQFFNYSEV